MNLLTLVIPAMVVLAIVVIFALGHVYHSHYENYYVLNAPIMFALVVIPILGVTGFFFSDALFLIASVICGIIAVIFGLSVLSPVCFLIGVTDVVAGALAFLVTILLAKNTFEWRSVGLFCNLFVYFQVFCTGALVLELFKKGVHFHSQ